ncbi:glucosidase 2 subunit beta-like isoform X2 [Euphorbia lathyris]|uniref:glucosidase 2 subunit beta-like isoform X2 n=1 Tax=Euphorbia lathyris TaxID=212925 RepID=UPI0033136983
MKINFPRFSLLIVIFSLNILPKTSSSSSSVSLLGIPPQDQNYFDREIIKCKNGSKNFTRAQLNDDFCDCPDGTDEPGTSACPEGKFYCRNTGHLPVSVPSSRVNDGICDCCDGSDEYDGEVKCPNTCWEAGKVARQKLQIKIDMYKGGVTLRKMEIEKGKRERAKDEDELSKLKNEEKILKGLVEQLKVYKEQIEKAEETVRLDEKEEEKIKELAEGEDEAGGKSDADQKENSSSDGNGNENMEPLKDDENTELSEDKHENMKDESESNEELSKEELGRRVASRWTGKISEHQAEESSTVKDSHGGSRGTSESSNNEIYDNSSEITNFSGSWLEKVKDAVRNIFQLINYASPPGDKLEANRVRKEYNDASARLYDLTGRISSLTDKLNHDFGTQEEFYSLYDQCFETKREKYIYNVCPFKEAYQQEDGRRTQLGYWEKFENSYQIMLFSNGQSCWNGPTRSIKVKLRCGLKTELTALDEPSRCEYIPQYT